MGLFGFYKPPPPATQATVPGAITSQLEGTYDKLNVWLVSATNIPKTDALSGHADPSVTVSVAGPGTGSRAPDLVLDSHTFKTLMDTTDVPDWNRKCLLLFKRGGATTFKLTMIDKDARGGGDSLLAFECPLPRIGAGYVEHVVAIPNGGSLVLKLKHTAEESRIISRTEIDSLTMREHVLTLKGGASAVVQYHTRASDDAKKAILMVPGRCDAYFHPHLAKALEGDGFDVFVLHHRNNGVCRRLGLVKNPYLVSMRTFFYAPARISLARAGFDPFTCRRCPLARGRRCLTWSRARSASATRRSASPSSSFARGRRRCERRRAALCAHALQPPPFHGLTLRARCHLAVRGWQGYATLLGYAFSTGGPVLLDYLRNRGDKEFDGFVLNSPFLDWGLAAPLETFIENGVPLMKAVGILWHGDVVDHNWKPGRASAYGMRQRAQYEFDPQDRPLYDVPVTVGYMMAANEAHKWIQALSKPLTEKPVLVLTSHGDTVLNHNEIIEFANKVATTGKLTLRVFTQMPHDVFCCYDEEDNLQSMGELKNWLKMSQFGGAHFEVRGKMAAQPQGCLPCA